MTLTPRLFAGALSPGDYRARVSKPGFDASDPNLTRDKLDFDTAWPFAGNIHAVVSVRSYSRNVSQPTVIPNPQRINFPALPYVPVIKCFASRPAGDQILWCYQGTNVTMGTITWEAYKDHVDFYTSGEVRIDCYMVVVVFKIPARDLDILGNDPHPLPRMMMGKRGTDYGLYVSRPGFNVETCSKAQMIFSSDDTFSVVNKTFAPASSRKGAADSPTANVTTNIDFTYEWKGYYPIIFFFGTFNGAQNDQIYTLPSDKVVNTYGAAYPMWATIISLSPGVGQVQIRRWGNEVWGNVSIIVLDHPVPTD